MAVASRAGFLLYELVKKRGKQNCFEILAAASSKLRLRTYIICLYSTAHALERLKDAKARDRTKPCCEL